MKTSKWLNTVGVLAITIGTLLTLPIALGWVGLEFGAAWNSGALERWQRLPDPPQPPTHLVAGYSSGIVYVETVDEQVFSCDVSEKDGCWANAQAPEDREFIQGPCDDYPQPLHYNVSTPPGKEIERIQTAWCHFEAGERRDYVLLDDGTIWTWEHGDANFLNIFRALVSIGCGLSLGVLGGIAVSVFVLRRWRRARAQNPARGDLERASGA